MVGHFAMTGTSKWRERSWWSRYFALVLTTLCAGSLMYLRICANDPDMVSSFASLGLPHLPTVVEAFYFVSYYLSGLLGFCGVILLLGASKKRERR